MLFVAPLRFPRPSGCCSFVIQEKQNAELINELVKFRLLLNQDNGPSTFISKAVQMRTPRFMEAQYECANRPRYTLRVSTAPITCLKFKNGRR